MIESSAHGDEYDGVTFSQLVCGHVLRFIKIDMGRLNFILMIIYIFCFPESY